MGQSAPVAPLVIPLHTKQHHHKTKMAPTVQKAAVVQPDGSVALREVTVPKLGPDEILVRVVAAAQNPADCASLTTVLSYVVSFNNQSFFFFFFAQGRVHCTPSALGQSLGATSQGLSRISGRTSRKVCAR